jgi:hypothetical protein
MTAFYASPIYFLLATAIIPVWFCGLYLLSVCTNSGLYLIDHLVLASYSVSKCTLSESDVVNL